MQLAPNLDGWLARGTLTLYKTGMASLSRWLVVSCILSCGCERRPPEPSPIVVSAPPPPASVDTRARSVSGSEQHDDPGRCMVPIATEPSRTPPPAGAQCPTDPVFGGVKLPTGDVTFLKGSDGSTIEVELATSPRQRERGLMFRRTMPENVGMLFAFERPEVHTFWMHNTCLPLDMLFITKDGFIAGIVENVPTLNDEPRSVPCPVSYVLEVNAGFARRHGVRPGQFVRLPL